MLSRRGGEVDIRLRPSAVGLPVAVKLLICERHGGGRRNEGLS